MKNKKKVILIIIILIIFLGFYWFNKEKEKNKIIMEKNLVEILDLTEKAESYMNGENGYNIEKVSGYYQQVLNLDPENKNALFKLARINYITSSFDQSLKYSNLYKKIYPEEKRIYYVSGLTNGFAGNLDQAERDFQVFVNSPIVNEAGFLDLAWIQFQKGDFEKAKNSLEKGIEFLNGEENAWINLSMGAVLINLKDKESALVFLQKAEEQADKITPEVWAINYSANNSDGYEEDIAKMKEIIKFNTLIAKGEKIERGKIEMIGGIGFESLSPLGEESGYVVSASCAANSGKACTSSANACGDVSTGTINCSGNCSVSSSPADPDWSGPLESSICAGLPFTQERCDGNSTRNLIGTKVSGVLSPSVSSVCSGIEFIQSRCGESKVAIGIKDCSSNPGGDSGGGGPQNCTDRGDCPVACSEPWIGQDVSDICSGVRFLKTKCGESGTFVGVKDCGLDVDTVTDPTQLPNDIVDIQCSMDKVNWGDCSSVIKLSFQGEPFYLRNLVLSDDQVCTDPVNIIGAQDTNNPLLNFSKLANGYKVKVIGANLDNNIFQKDIVGTCGGGVASKLINIKILNIKTTEI